MKRKIVLKESEIRNTIRRTILSLIREGKVQNKLIPFNIGLIPIQELKRQYIDYSIQLPITQYTDYGCVGESVNMVPIEPIIAYLKGKYLLKDWQCLVGYAHNDIDVGLVIPTINQNLKIISDEMHKRGYFVGASRELTIDEMKWMQYQFEPLETKPITDEIKEEGVLYHITQTFNEESILREGIIANNEDVINNNQEYQTNRPSLVFLLRGYTELPHWINIAKSLNNRRPTNLKTNEFTVFQIEVSKLPKEFEFYGDPQHPSGVSTPLSIPTDAIHLYRRFTLA